MKLRKKFISILCMALVLFSFALQLAPINAAASYAGAVEKVTIKLSMPAVQAAEVKGVTASISSGGCYISSMNWYDVYGQTIYERFDENTATLELVLTAASGYYFSDPVVTVDDVVVPYTTDGNTLVLSKSYLPYIWAPGIVKHPGSEECEEGGMVSFVSYASCADKSEWLAYDTKGNCYAAEKLMDMFPGLVVESSYDKLKLYPVPNELNGYKVACIFSGPGGTVASNKASISVVAAGTLDKASENSAAVPVATPEPTPAHVHQFGQQLLSDGGSHWYECECGANQMKAEHEFKWIQHRAATADSPGLVEALCTYCGYRLSCEPEMEAEAAAEAQRRQLEAEARTKALEEALIQAQLEAEENKSFVKKFFDKVGISE